MSKSIVITGSTRGIGYNLAAAFLERHCVVTISGRTQEAVSSAITRLAEKFDQSRIFGFPCDVTDYAQVQSLWEHAMDHFGRIDIWINNAGIAAPRMNIWEQPPQKYAEVVRTNLVGTLYGTKVAMLGLLSQGYGALYNMEGFGARGAGMRGMTLYGSTKSAVHFVDRSLALEAKGTQIHTGAISPGMMITDLVTQQFEGRQAELEKVRGILSIIAEKPETVAPVLADKILSNRKNGARINFSSPARIMWKFLIAPFHKRDLFA